MRLWPLLLALVVLVLGPIFLRPRGESVLKGEETVIVITPHNEAIRDEFSRGFREWYKKKTGRTILVDFRTPGGTSEITKFLNGEFDGAFRNYWVNTLHKAWTPEVASNFANSKAKPEDEARKAFLDSKVGCGVDVFFGGGSFDFQRAAGQGIIVSSGYVEGHPEVFGKQILAMVGGEPYFDAKGRWMGSTIGAFGIVSNRDHLARLGLPEPRTWSDLADPRYFHGLALANPTQSSSANKAFEMLIQQQMNLTMAELAPGKDEDPAAVAEGWARAMRLLQKVSANSRYFSDSSSKISLDVESGEAVAGMTIDFYGRFQSETVRRPDGTSRIAYVDAEGGTSFGVDPIALLRGAPHPEVAKAFIEYVMTDGQKLWGWKAEPELKGLTKDPKDPQTQAEWEAGRAGGPKQHALRRLPVAPELYDAKYQAFRSDPNINPYEAAKKFSYHEKWTSDLFQTFAFIVRVMCIDTHDELCAAWKALIDAKFPPQAMAAFENVDEVTYAKARNEILATLREKDKIREIQLAKNLAGKFRENYRRAEELAKQGK